MSLRRLRGWLVRVAGQLRTPHRRTQVAEEIEALVQLHLEENRLAGMSPGEARRAALIAVGPQNAFREDYLDRGGVPVVRGFADASREALRSLRRHRGFVAAVVGILSLGVGTAVALSDLVDALLFRPPAHIARMDRLVSVSSARNYPLFQAVERQSRTLDVAAFTVRSMNLGHHDRFRQALVGCVTSGYFRVLGTTPIVGRPFSREADTRGSHPSAVLAYGTWRRDFGGEPAAIGQTVTIGGRAHQIIGVAPPDFRGLQVEPIDVWISLAAAPEGCSFTGQSLLDTISAGWLSTIGRLRDDVSLQRAETEIRAMALSAERGAAALPERELVPVEIAGRRGRDGRLAIWSAAGAVLILAIACANVASLLLIRAIDRRREAAIRLQLGAGRGHLFTQIALEHLTMAGACTLAALLVARTLTAAMEPFFPAITRDQWIDGRMVGSVAVFALVAGLVAGLAPALRLARGGQSASFRVGHPLGAPRGRGRDALVVLQVALALVLVSGAGLFGASVDRAKSDVGYDLDRVIVVTVDFDGAGIRRQAQRRHLLGEVLERLRTMADVESVSLSSDGPLGSGQFATVMPGMPGATDALPLVIVAVSPDYFKTLGTRILAGRSFVDTDGPGAPRAAIVDSALAERMWPGQPAAGQCRSLAPGRPCTEIVGVAESRRLHSLTGPVGEVFYPLAQYDTHPPQAVLVRVAGQARDAIPSLAGSLRSMSPIGSFVTARPLEDLADVQARSWRLGTMMFGLFGGVAVMLAAVGLYSTLAFTVRQRTPEIGLRMALGATTGRVALSTLARGGTLIGVGWAIGLVGSVLFARSVESLLFGVTASTRQPFALGSAIVCAAAAAGCLLPVLHASRVDPVRALRDQ